MVFSATLYVVWGSHATKPQCWMKYRDGSASLLPLALPFPVSIVLAPTITLYIKMELVVTSCEILDVFGDIISVKARQMQRNQQTMVVTMLLKHTTVTKATMNQS